MKSNSLQDGWIPESDEDPHSLFSILHNDDFVEEKLLFTIKQGGRSTGEVSAFFLIALFWI